MENKRKQKRVGASYEVFLNHQGSTSMGRSRDISPTGMGLYTPEELAPGDTVEVSLAPSAEVYLKVLGQVRYCIENPDQSLKNFKCLAGIEFEKEHTNNLPFVSYEGEVLHFKGAHSISINCDAARCYRMLYDFERYPEWADLIESTRVVEKRPDGRAKKVEFVFNAFIKKVRYILDYTYSDDRLCLSWSNAGGDLLTVSGNYFFMPLSDKTTSSTFELTASLDFPAPTRIVKYFSTRAMRKTMKEFKNFVEKNAS